ncbi:MAG TPA: metallophosphoesterase, partial [Polyangiaceae bacterium]|nr:metallophosphoesterase [Polyangiaceae bacterium]
MNATALPVRARCPVHRGRRLAPLVFCSALSCWSCLVATPFGSEPEERNLNARNLERLKQHESRGGHTLTFAALGDTHAEYDDLSHAVRAINRQSDVKLVAHAGDMTDFGLLQEYDWSHRTLTKLTAPLFTAIGNHDAISDGATIYRKMYGPFDYSFEHAGVEFVFFNSNSLEFPESAPDQRWLRKTVLESDAPRGVVVVTHHTPWTSESPRSARRLHADLLASGKVRLWVHGHLEKFQLVTYHGVPILQCGTFQHSREHVLVTLRESGTTFRRCHYDSCAPVVPERDVTRE